MILAGLFAFVWSVVRARVQSMTLDEADTYFWFVASLDRKRLGARESGRRWQSDSGCHRCQT
jgi:hypothetical protein